MVYGAVAQLGEHEAGSLGVRGSIPLSSTKFQERGRRTRRIACRVAFSFIVAFRPLVSTLGIVPAAILVAWLLGRHRKRPTGVRP